MTKLFLKLWALILLTALVSYNIQETAFDWSLEATALWNSNERFRRTYVLIESALEPLPKAQWPARFEVVKNNVGTTDISLGLSRLLTLDALNSETDLDITAIQKIRAGEIYVRKAQPSGYEIFRTVLDTDVVVVLKAPFSRVQPTLVFRLFTFTQFTWLVESTLYALVIMLWLRVFRRDMVKLEKAANQVGEGRFDVDIDMKKGAALYPVADALNTMKARIRVLLESHRHLTNAISHELRTPITRLRFRYELAISASQIDEKNRELMAMDSAIDQLDELSTELLEYAKLDRGDPKLDIAPIDVEPWLAELTAEGDDLAQSSGREVKIISHTNLDIIHCDYRYMSRAVANLIRNAVRYTQSRVVVTAERVRVVDDVMRAQEQYVITVDDDGIGIPAAEREHLFEPFARLDKSRDRASGGFGIGLAIVKQVAKWHGGSARIDDAPIGGARLQIIWPTASNMKD